MPLGGFGPYGGERADVGIGPYVLLLPYSVPCSRFPVPFP